MKYVGNSSRGRSQGVPKSFRAPIYSVHCAVIFAIAHSYCSGFLESHTDCQLILYSCVVVVKVSMIRNTSFWNAISTIKLARNMCLRLRIFGMTMKIQKKM